MGTLAERLKKAREKAGLSQLQLAEQVGLTQQSIAKIENGVTEQPRKIKQLALALGVTAIGCNMAILTLMVPIQK